MRDEERAPSGTIGSVGATRNEARTDGPVLENVVFPAGCDVDVDGGGGCVCAEGAGAPLIGGGESGARFRVTVREVSTDCSTVALCRVDVDEPAVAAGILVSAFGKACVCCCCCCFLALSTWRKARFEMPAFLSCSCSAWRIFPSSICRFRCSSANRSEARSGGGAVNAPGPVMPTLAPTPPEAEGRERDRDMPGGAGLGDLLAPAELAAGVVGLLLGGRDVLLLGPIADSCARICDAVCECDGLASGEDFFFSAVSRQVVCFSAAMPM